MNSRNITAAWLREFRPSHGVLPLGADVAMMLADALEIADEGARSNVELYAVPWEFKNRLPRYYRAVSCDPDDAQRLDRSVRYLTARGLLETHPDHPHLVRVLDEPKVDA